MIPAGIRAGETEFMEVDAELFAMHEGHKTAIENLPSYVLGIVDLAIDPVKRKCLTDWGINEQMPQIKQFLKCNASVADATPDIANGKFSNEYVACPFRGKCRYEGKLCTVIPTESGDHLTFAEMRITSQIRAGLFDKEIAAACGISINTVKVHKQHIQTKLKVERKTMIVAKAIEIGIA